MVPLQLTSVDSAGTSARRRLMVWRSLRRLPLTLPVPARAFSDDDISGAFLSSLGPPAAFYSWIIVLSLRTRPLETLNASASAALLVFSHSSGHILELPRFGVVAETSSPPDLCAELLGDLPFPR